VDHTAAHYTIANSLERQLLGVIVNPKLVITIRYHQTDRDVTNHVVLTAVHNLL